jgi:hypothetical protein
MKLPDSSSNLEAQASPVHRLYQSRELTRLAGGPFGYCDRLNGTDGSTGSGVSCRSQAAR